MAWTQQASCQLKRIFSSKKLSFLPVSKIPPSHLKNILHNPGQTGSETGCHFHSSIMTDTYWDTNDRMEELCTVAAAKGKCSSLRCCASSFSFNKGNDSK